MKLAAKFMIAAAKALAFIQCQLGFVAQDIDKMVLKPAVAENVELFRAIKDYNSQAFIDQNVQIDFVPG